MNSPLKRIALEATTVADLDDDDGPFGFDIAIILAIVTQLLPLLDDCFENESSRWKADKVSEICTRGRLGCRYARFRTRRAVRDELGPDAERRLVKDIAEAIMESARTMKDDVTEAFEEFSG